MNKVSERAQRLQALLGDIAEKVAQNTNFIRRKRKITPIAWLLATVFGWVPKLWKSERGVALSHGKTGNRGFCEFLAKLLGQMIANWLMLLRGGQLGRISPTQLYRQVSRTVPDRKDEEALSAVIAKLVNRFDRIRPRKKRKKNPFTRQTLCENVIYPLS